MPFPMISPAEAQLRHMTKLALLGSGHIGQCIARRLQSSGDYRVTAFDAQPNALDAVRQPGVEARLISENLAELDSALAGHDIVVNALPFHFAATAARAARAAGCHYFDLTEDVAATRAIMDLADGASTAFMPQCGLAPGFIGIAAHHLAKQLQTVRDVKMRVGALPLFPDNALKYNLTWSIDGLINEYCHPCDAICDGRRVTVPALEGLECMSLDGREYEAFNTSGGLGTLCDTWAGKVINLDYKTIRYPGHRDLARFLLTDLKLRDDRETLKSILKNAIPTTKQDMVLVVVLVSGLRNEVFTQEVLASKIVARRAPDRSESAIQIATAAGICAAVDLFCEGVLPRSGFIRQEEIGLDSFLMNRFGKVFAESNELGALGRFM